MTSDITESPQRRLSCQYWRTLVPLLSVTSLPPRVTKRISRLTGCIQGPVNVRTLRPSGTNELIAGSVRLEGYHSNRTICRRRWLCWLIVVALVQNYPADSSSQSGGLSLLISNKNKTKKVTSRLFLSFYSAKSCTPHSPSWFSKTSGTHPPISCSHQVPVATQAAGDRPLTSLTLTKHTSGRRILLTHISDVHLTHGRRTDFQGMGSLKNVGEWVSESDDKGCSAINLESSQPIQWTSFIYKGRLGCISGRSTSNILLNVCMNSIIKKTTLFFFTSAFDQDSF